MNSEPLARFFRQFGTMIKSGMPMLRCLSLLEEQFPGCLSKVAGMMKQEVMAGATLAESARNRGRAFSPVEQILIEVGERSGRLDTLMIRMADARETAHRRKTQIISRLIYPALLIHFALGVKALMVLVFPGGGLMKATLFLAGAAAVLYGGGFGLFMVYRHGARLRFVRVWMDTILYHLPVVGGIVRNLGVARFCSVFETLYVAGTNHAQALDLAACSTGNLWMETRLRQAVLILAHGCDLGQALRSTGAFDAMVNNMIQTGVESGHLDEMLSKVSENADFVATTSINRLGIILPILTYLLVVIWIVVTVILPFWLTYFRMINELTG